MTTSRQAAAGCVVLALALLAVFVLAGTGAATPLAQEPQEPGVAQEVEHAVEEELHEEAEPKAWFHWPAKWVNFIALVALLYWLLVVPPQPVQDIFSYSGLRVILPERAAAIVAARDVATAQRDEAEHIVADAEQRLAKIDDEVAALASQARGDAEREQANALDDGKKQAEKILEVAQREISNERVGAHRQLRGFVADLAVNLAERTLADHLTADDQDRLIREYLSRLSGSVA